MNRTLRTFAFVSTLAAAVAATGCQPATNPDPNANNLPTWLSAAEAMVLQDVKNGVILTAIEAAVAQYVPQGQSVDQALNGILNLLVGFGLIPDIVVPQAQAMIATLSGRLVLTYPSPAVPRDAGR